MSNKKAVRVARVRVARVGGRAVRGATRVAGRKLSVSDIDGTGKSFVHLLLPRELIGRIDDFRFTNRFDSRAAAVLALLNKGLRRSL